MKYSPLGPQSIIIPYGSKSELDYEQMSVLPLGHIHLQARLPACSDTSINGLINSRMCRFLNEIRTFTF